ncbi:uncharacterized [Tachysurus ichikawai]
MLMSPLVGHHVEYKTSRLRVSSASQPSIHPGDATLLNDFPSVFSSITNIPTRSFRQIACWLLLPLGRYRRSIMAPSDNGTWDVLSLQRLFVDTTRHSATLRHIDT